MNWHQLKLIRIFPILNNLPFYALIVTVWLINAPQQGRQSRRGEGWEGVTTPLEFTPDKLGGGGVEPPLI